jgi:hypothetical protein
MSASKPTPMYMDRSWFGLRKYNGRRPQWDSPEGGCYVRNISGADAKFRRDAATPGRRGDFPPPRSVRPADPAAVPNLPRRRTGPGR